MGVPPLLLASSDFSRHSSLATFLLPFASAVTCATWRLYPLWLHSIAHTSRHHGGVGVSPAANGSQPTSHGSRLCDGGILCRVDELANFGALLVEFREMLLAEFLVHLDLLLGTLFFAGTDVRLAQAIVRVGQIGIQLQRALIFGNGVGVLTLLGVEIAELQMRLR